MSAGTYNMTAEQGAAFSRVIRYEDADEQPVNLTGYTARMQVRRQPYSATPLLELTTENDGITLGGATGEITLSISATTMADAQAGECWYDLELLPAGSEDDVVRLIEGKFRIKREVTREASE